MTLNVPPFVPERVPERLPGTRLLGLEARSEVEVVELLEAGLETRSAERLARHLGVSLASVLELAGIGSSTFHDRKKRGRTLSAEESGRVYRLAKLAEAAETYFGDPGAARRWLEHPKVALGGRSPLAFGRSAEGAAYVLALLGRMAHGVISLSVVTAYRISDARYRDTLSGIGAYLYGGRWNSPGQYVAYVSGNVSLAMLEVLVHIDDAEAFLGRAHVYQAVRFGEAHVTVLDQGALPARWNARPETVDTQGIGDEWLARRASVVLAVPSVVVPGELRFEREYLNYLVNPRHPDFDSAVQPGELRDLDWDPRFKRR